MNKHDGYKEILDFISKHGIEDKDSKFDDKNKSTKKLNIRNSIKEKTIDLHGKREEEAEKILRNSIQNAISSGNKKLLIIHGKGLHSDPFEGPVLKKLVESMLSFEFKTKIREFYPAPHNKGGSGATIVILK